MKGHAFRRAEKTGLLINPLGLQPEGSNMSKLTRPVKSPAYAIQYPRTFFLTSSTWNHRSLFQAERMARLFLDVLYCYRSKNCYRLHEFVLMADHFHLLVTLAPGMLAERAVQFIKGGFSFRASKDAGFRGEVWERGFADRLIRNEREFGVYRGYIWRNPVKRGLVAKADEYPYSSAHPGVELDAPPQGLKPGNRWEAIHGTPEGVPLHTEH